MKNLRKLREARKITLKALGDEIGVAECTVSLYETGKREPDIATIKHLANFFHVSTDYLFGLTDDPCFSVGPLAAFIRMRRGEESEESFAQHHGIDIKLLQRIEEGFREDDTGERSKQINSLSTEEIRTIANTENVMWEYIAALYDGYDPERLLDKPDLPEDHHKMKHLIKLYCELNEEGQALVADYTDTLVASGKYIKSDPAELGKTKDA